MKQNIHDKKLLHSGIQNVISLYKYIDTDVNAMKVG